VLGADRRILSHVSEGRLSRSRRPRRQPGQPKAPQSSAERWTFWIFALALLVATLAVYHQAWHGGMLWDDNFHLTRPDLRSWQGLGRIWTERGATLQYYPLLHSVFWLQYRLWGDTTLGYHLVTILAHVVAPLLLASILRRPAVPGAYPQPDPADSGTSEATRGSRRELRPASALTSRWLIHSTYLRRYVPHPRGRVACR
jgi:hypothetical protein